VPKSAANLVILRSKNLKTAQDVTHAIRGLSIFFTILAFGLFAVAVMVGRGARRLIVRNIGWCFFGLGLVTLLMRRVLTNQLVDSLVKADSVKPAVHDTLNIATSLLYAIGVAFVIYGVIIVLAAALMGEASWATSARRWLAPTLREHPGRAYGVAGLAYLLVLAWGPTPAFRNLIPIVLIGALIALGVEALRRSAADEFPPGPGGGDGIDLAAPKPALGHG